MKIFKRRLASSGVWSLSALAAVMAQSASPAPSELGQAVPQAPALATPMELTALGGATTADVSATLPISPCHTTVSTKTARKPTDDTVAKAQAALSLDLVRALASANKGGTTVSVSPSSIAAVFSALALGADETMQHAIGQTLRLSGKSETQLAKMRAALRLLDVGRTNAPMRNADALFVDQSTALNPSFEGAALAEARLRVRREDLGTKEGLAAVNAFVTDATGGLIPGILDTPLADPALVAVNAFYFKDCWQTVFDPAQTALKPFRKAQGGSIDVPTMHLINQPLATFVKGRFAAVELNYRDPAFSMVLVTTTDVPASPGDFAQVSAMLAGESFKTVIVDLALPSFSVQGTQELLSTLSSLGLKAGLASPKALSGIADGLRLGAVHQKTFVVIDEQGTVAAAATAAVATRSAAVTQKIAFDKPFVFALRHRPTGLVLMTGYVADPRAPGASR